jgi:F-type H+-transporting ATPase subunit epsilon
MRVTVISPGGSVFEGPADSVIAPAYDGQVGILPRHAPFMTLLGQGTVRIRGAEGSRAIRVKGGFLQVARNTVRIVAEYAEHGDEAGNDA